MNTVKLRKRRRELDLSQEEAARIAGLGSKQVWQQIESGVRSDVKLSQLVGMAKAVQLHPYELLNVDPPSSSASA